MSPNSVSHPPSVGRVSHPRVIIPLPQRRSRALRIWVKRSECKSTCKSKGFPVRMVLPYSYTYSYTQISLFFSSSHPWAGFPIRGLSLPIPIRGPGFPSVGYHSPSPIRGPGFPSAGYHPPSPLNPEEAILPAPQVGFLPIANIYCAAYPVH